MPVNDQNFRWKQKCQALFSGAAWTPKVGDYCTPRDSSLKLFRVEEIGMGGMKLRTVFDPGVVARPPDEDAPPATMVWVPDFVLGTGERDRPRIVAEAGRPAPEPDPDPEPVEDDDA
jgi:hypothetical protein